MDAPTQQTIGGLALAGLGWAAAWYERIKSTRSGERERLAREQESLAKQHHSINEQILAQKDQLCDMVRKTAEAYKQQFEEEHNGYLVYREKTHALQNEQQAKLLKLTEENAELRAKTDLTPLLKELMAFQSSQNTINTKIVDALEQVLGHLAGLQAKPSV